RESTEALVGALRLRAEPGRDRSLDRQRSDAGSGHSLEGAVMRHRRLGPQAAEQRDLLLHPYAAVGELLAERLVFDGVPAEADAEPELAVGEQIHLRRLLGHERGLALGKDDDA